MGNVPKFEDNCFHLIRIVAALQVFLGHASAHLSYKLPSWMTMFFPYTQGVPIFFILSGFLLWKSIGKPESDFKTFVQKRVLRLYPELWGAVIVNACLILYFQFSGIEWKSFLAFNLTQATCLQFWTPDSLRGYGCGTPNGSLWTICVMIQCYLVLWMIYRWLHKKKIYAWFGVLLCLVAINIITPSLETVFPTILYKLYLQTFLPYMWMFLFGAFLSEYYHIIVPYLVKFWYLSVFLAVVITRFVKDVGCYDTFRVLCVGLMIIAIGYRLKMLKLPVDISYGLYIYHMVVINVMIEMGYTKEWWNLMIAFLLSLTLAIVSYAISKRVLKKYKKNRCCQIEVEH